MKYTPHEYQKYITGEIIQKKRMEIFMEMGLGKTSCTLAAIDYLLNDTMEINKVLVISPLKVARLTWEEEIQKWDELNHLRISKVVGTLKQRIKALETPSDIYIVNRENTKWILDYYRSEQRWPFQMLVIDESSSFKNRASNRFKAAKVLAKVTPRLIELTGTPIPNGLMDLWSQIYLLDEGARLGATLTAYRNTFFDPDKRSRAVIFSYKPKPGANKEIYRRIGDITMSLRNKDYLEMPERIVNDINIDMTPNARKIYEEMKYEYLVSLDEEVIVAANAAVVENKLLQMANGACYVNEGRYVEIHDLKIQALREIMEGNEGKPVMVIYQYRHDLERLQKAFADLNPRTLDKDQDKKDWDEGRIMMLLAHPASMGHGLNLQAGGNIIVWFGLTWNLEQYEQANARLYRQGQKNAVIINHLIVKDTEDETALLRLAGKGINQDELVNAVKAQIRAAKERKTK